MKLQPLSQWICDTCGDVIEKPADGWFEWLHDKDGLNHSFRLCHRSVASPIRKEAGGEKRGPSCYRLPAEGRADLGLEDMSGNKGMVRMLMFIDVGALHDPKAKHLGRVKDLREWTVMFRRLFLPYFEEARAYFKEAEGDGYFADMSEVLPYLESTLKDVIEEYGEDES